MRKTWCAAFVVCLVLGPARAEDKGEPMALVNKAIKAVGGADKLTKFYELRDACADHLAISEARAFWQLAMPKGGSGSAPTEPRPPRRVAVSLAGGVEQTPLSVYEVAAGGAS